MSRIQEKALYSDVSKWLAGYLKGLYPRSDVSAHDTHAIDLASFIRRENIQNSFPDYSTFDIQVDVTGVVRLRAGVKLAFVECKIPPMTLRDVGQLLGYSLVAKPHRSFLVSPSGLSARLSTLMNTFGRLDILQYGPSQTIVLAEWNLLRGEVNFGSTIPKGAYH